MGGHPTKYVNSLSIFRWLSLFILSTHGVGGISRSRRQSAKGSADYAKKVAPAHCERESFYLGNHGRDV